MRVMRAVDQQLLSLGMKLMALEVYGLDNDLEGAKMGATNLAQRLGVQPETIEKGRRELMARGLLAKLPAARGTVAGWVVTMPDDCIPASERPGVAEVQMLARRLEGRIRACLTPAPAYATPPSPTRMPMRGGGVSPYATPPNSHPHGHMPLPPQNGGTDTRTDMRGDGVRLEEVGENPPTSPPTSEVGGFASAQKAGEKTARQEGSLRSPPGDPVLISELLSPEMRAGFERYKARKAGPAT
jgi:hypothetical protein